MENIIYVGKPQWNFGLLVNVSMVTWKRMQERSHQKTLPNDKSWIFNYVHYYGNRRKLCALLWQSEEPNILGTLRTFKTCTTFWKKARLIFASNIQRPYDSSHKLASLKQIDHDKMSFIANGQFVVNHGKFNNTTTSCSNS